MLPIYLSLSLSLSCGAHMTKVELLASKIYSILLLLPAVEKTCS